MTLANDNDALCMLILFLAILIFTKAKIRLADLFMLGGLCYLMIDSRRQITMFALLCSVIFSRFIVQLMQMYTKQDDKKLLKKATSWIRNDCNNDSNSWT